MFGKLDLHIARAGLSPVLVYTVRGPQGEPVRVLSSGGVFQSATYLGCLLYTSPSPRDCS